MPAFWDKIKKGFKKAGKSIGSAFKKAAVWTKQAAKDTYKEVKSVVQTGYKDAKSVVSWGGQLVNKQADNFGKLEAGAANLLSSPISLLAVGAVAVVVLMVIK